MLISCMNKSANIIGKFSLHIQVKLSGQPAKSQIIWAGRQVLATASGESVVRQVCILLLSVFSFTLWKH